MHIGCGVPDKAGQNHERELNHALPSLRTFLQRLVGPRVSINAMNPKTEELVVAQENHALQNCFKGLTICCRISSQPKHHVKAGCTRKAAAKDLKS